MSDTDEMEKCDKRITRSNKNPSAGDLTDDVRTYSFFQLMFFTTTICFHSFLAIITKTCKKAKGFKSKKS